MNCYLHPETPASAFCRSCGRPLCALCQRVVDGTIFCQDHVPSPAYTGADPNLAGGPNPAGGSNPYVQPPPPAGAAPSAHASPALAFILGFIPGVGAIYNGQYLKGLVHAIIFGALMSLTQAMDHTSGQPLLVMMMVAFVFYMPFEAYHTAKNRRVGVRTEEWSSLVGSRTFSSHAPVGPIVLIALGALFLLDTLNILHFREIGRFWPVLLIVIGAYMLWSRVSPAGPVPTSRIDPSAYSAPRDPGATRVAETRHE